MSSAAAGAPSPSNRASVWRRLVDDRSRTPSVPAALETRRLSVDFSELPTARASFSSFPLPAGSPTDVNRDKAAVVADVLAKLSPHARPFTVADIDHCYRLARATCGAPIDVNSSLLLHITALLSSQLPPEDVSVALRALTSPSVDPLAPVDFRLPWKQRFLSVFDDLLILLCPTIPARLAAMSSHSSLVFGPAIVTLWSSVLPADVQLRVIDAILDGGCFGLLRTSLQIVMACEGLISTCVSPVAVVPALAQFLGHTFAESASSLELSAKLFPSRPEWLPLARCLWHKTSLIQSLCCIPRVPPRGESDVFGHLAACVGTIAPKMAQWPLKLDGYDWIGFDLDHTLIEYNNASTEKLFRASAAHIIRNCNVALTELSTHGRVAAALSALFGDRSDSELQWPPTLSTLLCRVGSPSAWREADIPYWSQFSRPGFVVDKRRGNVLIVDESGAVSAAYHGAIQLSNHTVATTYGSGNRWHSVDEGDLIADADRAYFFVHTYFDAPIVPLFAVLVNNFDEIYLKRSGGDPRSRHVNYSAVANAVLTAVRFVYTRFCQFGFNEIMAAPEKYVGKQPKVKKWLESVRKIRRNDPDAPDRIRLFVLTNADYDHADVFMSYAYGADWVSLFDLVIVGARKRQFFTAFESPAEDMFDESDVGIERASKAKADAASATAPRNFLPVDPVLRKVMVRAVVTGSGTVSGIDLSQYTVYAGGNAQALNAFLQSPLAYETGAVKRAHKPEPAVTWSSGQAAPVTRTPRKRSESFASRVHAVCYVGDNLLQDVWLPATVGWSTVYVNSTLADMVTRACTPSADSGLSLISQWTSCDLATAVARDRGILNVPSVNWLAENVPVVDGLGWSLRGAASACRLPSQAVSTLSVTPADVTRSSGSVLSSLACVLCGCRRGRATDPAALPADVTDAPNCYPKGPVEIDASGAALSRVPMLYPDEAGVWKFGAEAAAVVAASAAPSISPK